MSIDDGTCGQHPDWRGACRAVLLLMLLAAAPAAVAATGVQKSYASPAAAISGLVEIVKANDKVKLSAILGPHGSKLISSGDPVADERGRAAFLKAYEEANRLVLEGDAKASLVIGKDDWPFPIPLVKSDDRWRFDTAQGEQEILDRRIGRNELAAMQVCLAIVDAEREYAADSLGNSGVPRYTSRIFSLPGKRDGLYWPAKPGEPPSPLGPLVAAAASEGYTASRPPLSPYHGYFYRILSAQGKEAPGGEYEYFVKGKMIGGFAVIAYPARYGASGIKTFTVNHDGVVYEKDLGQETAAVARQIKAYNPDSSWRQVDLQNK